MSLSRRGSSMLNDTPLMMRKPVSESNVFLDLMVSSFYTVIGYVCLDIVFAITLHYIGVNNPESQAGLGLAFIIVNTLMIPMGLGTNQSLNLHSAHALGAQKPKLAQNYFSLAMLFHLMYFVPLGILILALKRPIAMIINIQDRQTTSDHSQQYLYFLLPSSLLAILYEGVKSFMIAHKIFAVFMYIQLCTTALHIFWCELFIVDLKLGIDGIAGAGIAIILTECLNCFLLFSVIYLSNYKDRVFENYSLKLTLNRQKQLFKSFCRASVPIVIHIYADFFVFFLLSFIAVGFSTEQLNAQIALANTSNVYYKFPIALSLALMTYIGNEMGSKNIKRAKQYAWIGILFFVIFTSVFLILLTIFKQRWARFYSLDPDTIDIILDVFPIFGFGFFIIDGLQGTLTGILKGIEKKEFVTYSTLLVYYLIGIPLVVYFAYDFGFGLKVYGIWLAFTIMNAILAILYIWAVFTTNWKVQQDFIGARVEKQNQMQNLDDSLNKEIDEYGLVVIKQSLKAITSNTSDPQYDQIPSNGNSIQIHERRQQAREQQGKRGESKDYISLQQQQPFQSLPSNLGSSSLKNNYALPGEKKRTDSKDSDTN